MKLKIQLILLLVCLSTITLQAQNIDTQYEPNPQYPYGRPHPKLMKAATAFDPIIGSCDCRSLARNANQSWGDTTNLRWEFKYIMNGSSVQDITWLDNDTYTSSIRQYNADSAKWYVTFFSSGPGNPTPSTWEGGMKDDNIVLYNEQAAPNGMEGFYRITFKDISENGFNWRGEWVDKTEKVVFPTWLIWCEKRNR